VFPFGSGILVDRTFSNNGAGGSGGGVACRSQCQIGQVRGTFDGNSAGALGGGLWSDTGVYIVTDGAFDGNIAVDGAAIGISGYYAGYYDWDDYNYYFCFVTATNTTFTNNSLNGGDGGIAYLDGAVDQNINVTFDGGSTWSGNTPADVEWVKNGGVMGSANLISGDDYTCTPFGGCP
jgi:predicted outer membrane repeat protein